MGNTVRHESVRAWELSGKYGRAFWRVWERCAMLYCMYLQSWLASIAVNWNGFFFSIDWGAWVGLEGQLVGGRLAPLTPTRHTYPSSRWIMTGVLARSTFGPHSRETCGSHMSLAWVAEPVQTFSFRRKKMTPNRDWVAIDLRARSDSATTTALEIKVALLLRVATESW